ncbi:cytoglobin-1 isoform X4 [Anthonomus grandis grandis]|uniref:cytoglobin-1 isoform X4 n=1 Tax=Anthonomus grandis grandis TaxID=2921223 RepID=UPI0021651042|nr:cytoglobin-1 isoform X4 [Anthonomus grandis grandis]
MSAMGHIVSAFTGTGRTDDPDPVTGLTSRDRYYVTSSWARLMKNPTDSGVALLTLFFKKYPEYIELFPFKDLDPSEFPTNARFRAHCNSVVYALSAVVDSLDTSDVLVELLTKTGSSHSRRKVTREGFLHLKETALELFSTLFKPEELDAWKKTFDVAFSVIIKGLEAATASE